MFKIEGLKLYSKNNEEYTYLFTSGINYFKGSNDTGKTEFYLFIDYMLGDSEDLTKNREWFNNFLKARLKFTYNNISYIITRTKDSDYNHFDYADEIKEEIITLREYKDRLNQVFGANRETIKKIKEFTGQELTYRTFTLFSFLGETGQGRLNDFFDKCSNLEYKIKLPALLDLIFNKNIEEIFELEKELDSLISEVAKLEKTEFKIEYMTSEINNNIKKLGLDIEYTGYNSEKVINKLNEAKNLHSITKKKSENIAQLQYMFNHINEQIKLHENAFVDMQQIDIANKNRKQLLVNLNELIKENDDFGYLVEPIEKILLEIDNAISLSNYLISDNTISLLTKKKNKIKKDIEATKHYFKLYDLDEKERACALLENYLSEDLSSFASKIKEKKRRIAEIKGKLKELKKFQDTSKIRTLSKEITELYKNGISSEIINKDFAVPGFKINYVKKWNMLQPKINAEIEENGSNKTLEVDYYPGSMARHTLMQLCGYFGFLNMFLKEPIYPIIPILVIDHISKPFDDNNKQAIGQIINKAIEKIGAENLQVFMFDDKSHEELLLTPHHLENLVTENKTGFIPFYKPNNIINTED